MMLLRPLALVALTAQVVVGQDPECSVHANCSNNDNEHPHFCYFEGSCEPCTGGWWGEDDTGTCRPDLSIDDSCSVCDDDPPRTDEPTASPVGGAPTTPPEEYVAIDVANFSFETGTDGWSVDGSTRFADELAAAPHGVSYVRVPGGESGGSRGVRQDLAGVTVVAGRTYVATVWARSVNPPSVGSSVATTAKIGLVAGLVAETTSARVEAPVLSAVTKGGAPTDTIGDDGVNIWFENGYRMHAAGWFYSQKVGQDPVRDPWTKRNEAGGGMAKGPIIVKGGPKATYDTFATGDDSKKTISRIDRVDLKGKAPNYTRATNTGDDAAGEIYETVLSHQGDQSPWVIDAHITYDTDTNKLWMAWGGHALWVTEMDPKTGNVIGNPKNTEFDSHPAGTHRCVAAWEPREFRTCPGADKAPAEWYGDANGVAYHEGPSLYKKGAFWYYCASYGSMGFSYTIRCCRSKSPKGPFVDKDNIGCTKFDQRKDRFGTSMLLGPEGHQAVPGHPHMWAEADGREYLGYDFRNYQTGKSDDIPIETDDEMGIRELYWVYGWPTIWTPLRVTFVANDHPETIGQKLSIQLQNDGASPSLAAFDAVKVYYYDVSPPVSSSVTEPIGWPNAILLLNVVFTFCFVYFRDV